MTSLRSAIAGAMLACLLAPAGAAAEGPRTPRPAITIEKKGECVAPVEEMRRNHMLMLKHDRDRTMRQGIRKVRASLQGCVSCHASSRTGSVVAAKEDFCASCHAYAGVTLDCFECHSGKPKPAPAAVQGREQPSNEELLASMLRGRGVAEKGSARP
ncbi:MAG: hypothetical protein OHK0026_14820 [Rhodocyclaceae bacterium]